MIVLSKEAGAAALDRLDLGLGPSQAGEARGQLGAVPKLARAGLDGAQGSAGLGADVGGQVASVEWAVLLGLLAVAGERVRERLHGRGRVDMRGVVDMGWGRALAQEADHGLASLVEETGGRQHFCGRVRCCVKSWRRGEVKVGSRGLGVGAERLAAGRRIWRDGDVLEEEKKTSERALDDTDIWPGGEARRDGEGGLVVV